MATTIFEALEMLGMGILNTPNGKLENAICIPFTISYSLCLYLVGARKVSI